MIGRTALEPGPARPRLARRGRRAPPPRDRGRAARPAGRRLGGGRGDRDQRGPRRRDAQRLRHRRRRLLADLGRGAAAAARAQRVGPERRRPPTPRALRDRGLDDAAAPRPAQHHRAGRGPVLGRRPRAVRAADPGRGPGPGHRAGTRRLPGLGRVHRRGRDDGAALVDEALGRRRRVRGRVPAARPRLATRASASACRPSPTRSRRSPATGSTRSTTATSASARRAPWRPPGRRSARRPRGRTRSTWGEPISIDYRGVRVTTHPPNSSGRRRARAARILLERFEPPGAAAFGPEGVTDPRWIHLGIEAAKLAMADRDAYLTDPAFARRAGRAAPRPGPMPPTLAARIDPARAAPAAAATNPRGGGTIYLAAVDGDGQRGEPHRVELPGLRLRASSTRPPASTTRTGAATSAWTRTTRTSSSRGKRTLHTLLPGMLFRDGQRRAVGRRRRRWAATPSHRSTPSSCRASVDGGVDIRTAVAAPRWYVEPADHFAPPTDVRLEPRHARRHRRGAARRSATTWCRPRAVRFGPRARARDRARRRRTGASRRLGGGRDRPAQRGPAGRLVSGRSGCGYARVRRWQAALTRRRHRRRSSRARPCRGDRVTSNVGQNYPYTSETEAERAAAIARLVAEREGLAATLAAEIDAARCQRALVGLEVPDARVVPGCSMPRVCGREARGLRRLRRDLRQDLPALGLASVAVR